MTEDIRQVLDAAGYTESPATEEALRQCFTDYADAGVFGLTADEEEFTPAEMIRALRRYCR